MKFSIIIPTKNELKNMKKVLPMYEQLSEHFEHEVIVADGKSDDGTIEYARQHANHVVVKTKEERETIGEGRNRGAAVATGDIYMFIDAGVIVDDLIHFFKAVHETFEDDRIVAATTNVRIDPKLANWQDKVVHEAVNFLVRTMNVLGKGAGKGEIQMIRATAFKQVNGYNEKLAAAEDNELYRRLAKIGKTVFLPDLQVFDDPRRYRVKGYPHVIGKWILNQVSVMVRGKSFDKEWKRIG